MTLSRTTGLTRSPRTPLRAQPRAKGNRACECGCGQLTSLAAQTDSKRGYVRGEPVRFVVGHGGHEKLRKSLNSLYHEEDHGYGTPCWVWEGGTTSNGYGRTRYEGRMQPAHRVFFLRTGAVLPTGLQLDHLCRVPLCVNPEHLEPVTAAENVQRSSRAKLTPQDVEYIREVRRLALAACAPKRDGVARRRVPNGRAIRADLAARYGVTPDQIKHIWGGRSWAS